MVNTNLFPLSRLVYPTGAQLGRSDRVAGRALVLFRKNPPCVHPLAHRTKGWSQFGVVYLLKWARCPVPLESGQGFYHVAWETNCAHHLGMSAVLPSEQLCSPPGALTVLSLEWPQTLAIRALFPSTSFLRLQLVILEEFISLQ